MKLFLLCALFAPILFLALRNKNRCLWLVLAFVGILPEQFAVQLHEKLPLLSGSRVLILALFACWLWEHYKTRKFSFPISLGVFLGVNVLISLVHLLADTDEINRIFVFVMERTLLAVMIAHSIKDRRDLERGIDFLILGSVAVAVMGILQTVFSVDIAAVLHLRQTLASVSIADRMGLTRAYATSNAISYGCYCAFMVLPIFYRLQQTGRQRYSAAFALNFVALIATFTRSAWLCIGGIFLLLLVLQLGRPIRRLIPAGAMVVALCLVLCCVQPKFGGALIETGKSSVNTILSALPLEALSSEAPPAEAPSVQEPQAPTEKPKPDVGFELSKDFGANGEDPTYSRMAQWSAVTYMIREGKLLLGYGYNAFPEGKLHFYFDRWGAQWNVAKMLDVGLVALITESGLLGTLAHLGLLGWMFLVSWKHRGRKGSFNFCSMTLYMIPLYLLLNFLAAFLQAAVVWLYIGLWYGSLQLDKLGQPEQPAQPETKWVF